ncbi:hypothetical protein Tco_1289084 [Tanacetum coccineum]
MANDDPILTTMRFIPQHEVVQRYGAILPYYLTNLATKESKAYKTYHDIATGKVQPKPKYVRRSSRTKSDEAPKPSFGKRVKTTAKEKPEQAPKASSGKRLKAIAKVTKSGKKKQHAKGLETIFEIAFSEAKQMKLAIERSKTQLHSSQPSGSEQISWESSDEEDDHDEANIGKDEDDNDQDDDERTESDNDGDDFVHPKLSTYDDEARNDDEVNEEESNDESNDEINDEINEESDEEVQGANTKEEEMDEEATHEEDEANELYRDVNVNLEGRDTVMTDAPLPNVQATQETEDTHVILTAQINPEDVLVTTIAEPPFVSVTTLPPPPTPLITHMQQTLVPTLTTVPSTSLQDLPNFGSLFGFNHRLKTLETDFFEFKQTNQFVKAVSSILGIVDAYLANKMNEAVKTTVQLQYNRLKDEAQAENEDFLNKLDDNIKKIIKNQVKEQVKAQVSKILPKIEKTVNKQLKAEIMTRSSTESKTSLAIATNLSELELKKILIEKMESNKDDEDKDEEPSARSNRESKRRRARKEPESTSTPKKKTPKSTGKSTEGSKSLRKSAGESAHAEEPIHTAKDLEEPTHQEFETGATEDQPVDKTPQPSNCPRESFDELMDTPLDFLAFMMNWLKVDTLTPELLARQQYPHDLRKLLPLIPNSRGRQVIPFGHFINNDLAYLSSGVLSRTYATFVTKTKATDYGHIKWIEDLVPNIMWSEVPVNYDKHALWGISHWARKRQQFYAFAANRESARDVYCKYRIIAIIKL